MAPLVVIRAGAKEIEYRDPRASWKQRVELMLRERELLDADASEEDHDSDEVSDDGDDASSSGNSDDEERGDKAHDTDHGGDGSEEGYNIAKELQKLSIYGMSSELLALGGMHVFRCAACANVVADRDDIIAKSFFGRTGKAFLMNSMFNVRTGAPRNRYLLTGMHTICDVHCKRCDVVLGWKYIRAMESAQKYKEGKFIMERAVVEDDADEIEHESVH